MTDEKRTKIGYMERATLQRGLKGTFQAGEVSMSLSITPEINP